MTEIFTADTIEDLVLLGPDELAESELMSPFVWRLDDERFGILVRVVPAPDSGSDCTGIIWFGEGSDGLTFTMDAAAVIGPEPGGLDGRGCEDPTVVVRDGETMVFYTGVDAAGAGHLLWASGPDARSLSKKGEALLAFDGEINVKEAEVAIVDGRWTLAYEYAQEEASKIGVAEGEGPTGPWRREKYGFESRPGSWDDWHLSPGPPVMAIREHSAMFYNGATHDAVWAIGWIVFDDESHSVAARCTDPLVASPGEAEGRNMAFAASALLHEQHLDLYFCYNDRTLHRAKIVWDAEALRTARLLTDGR